MALGWLVVAGVTTAQTVLADDLRAALVAGLSPAILPAASIHAYQPPNPAAPMAWIGPLGMQPDTIGDGQIAVVTVTGSVYAPVDGELGAQVDACRTLAPAIWQAIDTIATPTAQTVEYIDVGGPTLFGVVVTFAAVVSIASLCPPTLVTQEATP